MNGKPLDLVGQRFGRLVVLERIDNYVSPAGRGQQTRWLCRCDCGKFTNAIGGMLTRGKKKSCGCLRNETAAKNQSKLRKHGQRGTRLYSIWSGMKKRCNNPNATGFANYGGRGICVCPSWEQDFLAFQSWAIESGYNDSLSLDRIDVDGNYEPSNCRWVTQKAQGNNRRTCHYLSHDGKTMSIEEWSLQVGIPASTIQHRVSLGWSPDRALTEPVHTQNRRQGGENKKNCRADERVKNNDYSYQQQQ